MARAPSAHKRHYLRSIHETVHFVKLLFSSGAKEKRRPLQRYAPASGKFNVTEERLFGGGCGEDELQAQGNDIEQRLPVIHCSPSVFLSPIYPLFGSDYQQLLSQHDQLLSLCFLPLGGN